MAEAGKPLAELLLLIPSACLSSPFPFPRVDRRTEVQGGGSLGEGCLTRTLQLLQPENLAEITTRSTLAVGCV